MNLFEPIRDRIKESGCVHMASIVTMVADKKQTIVAHIFVTIVT